MSALLEEAGCKVLANEAMRDAALQADQIRAMAEMGAKVIIVVVEDGRYLVPIVDELAARPPRR